MALSDIVNVTITLSTTAVTVAGFGVPIFASEHRWFTERAKTYTSITTVAEDIPTGSPEYVAAQGFFNSTPSPSTIMIGRRKVDTVSFLPDAATAVGQVYTTTVTGTDDVASVGTFTSITGSETAIAISTALVTSLGAVTGVTITDTGIGPYTVAATVPTVDDYTIGDISTNITAAYTTTETASEMLANVRAEEDDWYFMTSNDHTEDFVNNATTGMAAAIGATEKLYFMSSQDTRSLVAYTGVEITGDTVGNLKVNQRERSVGFFHQDADLTFPECNFISKFAPKNPGEEVWTQKNIGVSVSQDPTTRLNLSGTQLGYLADRSCNLVQSQGGVAIVRQGYTASGEDIATMRFRDFLTARMTEAYQLKAINTPGKIPYTDSGINGQRSVCESVLNRYVSTPDQPRGLQETPAYVTTFPRRADVSQSDVLAGILRASFTAYLSGAIRETIIQGNLQFEDLAS
jgi:hypothetical protein